MEWTAPGAVDAGDGDDGNLSSFHLDLGCGCDSTSVAAGIAVADDDVYGDAQSDGGHPGDDLCGAESGHRWWHRSGHEEEHVADERTISGSRRWKVTQGDDWFQAVPLDDNGDDVTCPQP